MSSTKQQVDAYHAKHGAEFRLRCMIGAAKGNARLAKTVAEHNKYMAEATELQLQLDKIL